ncbi:MAG: GAF domain-containing SpoIIE family protein phosphatase [Candidatus Brocadiia bacterium]|jgi:sigma-B regulation protein RsbU (phosphoserine phosphatase)
MIASLDQGQSFVQAIFKEISDIVASQKDSERVLNELVRRVGRMLEVNRCSLMLIEPGGKTLRIRAAHGIAPDVVKAARIRMGEGIAGWVALHGRPLLVKDVATHPLFKRQSAAHYSTRSLLSVPLLFRDRVIGVLNVNNKRDGAVFKESDQVLLSTVANFLVIALEKAELREVEEEKKRIDFELDLAQDIQQAFLPKAFPAGGNLQFAAYCHSARKVAGDFYDVLPLIGNMQVVLLGDVCGKGIAAALYMARVMSYFRAVASLRNDAEGLLPYVNRFLAREWCDRTFATALMVVINMDRSTASIYGAGHSPPYLICEKRGTLSPVAVKNGLPLGVDENCEYDGSDLTLESGDSLVLYTDGITDAVDGNGEFFGAARLEEVLRTHHGQPDALVSAVAQAVSYFSTGQPQTDDQTILVVRRT